MATLVLKHPNLNAMREGPRMVEVDINVLTPRWTRFCRDNNVKLHMIVLSENRAGTGKLWPASSIAVRGVSRGEHSGAEVAIDSTSGGYALAWAVVISEYRRIDPTFPIKHFVAVIPRATPAEKRQMLEEAGVELVDAPDSQSAMKLASQIAEERGYWYTKQYWNPDNSAGYYGVAHWAADHLPDTGLVAWGVGSGGGCSGVMPVFKERFTGRSFGLRRVAVVVEDGERVGGVRDAFGLKPGSLEWRAPNVDGVRFVGEDVSYLFSSAIWRQGEFVGPSTGFAAEGAMLAARELELLRLLDEVRAPDEYVHMLIPSLDDRRPYRSEYEGKGIYLADSAWR